MEAVKRIVIKGIGIFFLGALALYGIDESLIQSAQKEGRVNSLGMPDAWANWKETWEDLKSLYGIEHSDTDMSSAQEIAKFKAERKNASGDIGDVGISFGDVAIKQGVTQPFKTSYWEQIPQWAKDKEWALDSGIHRDDCLYCE